MTNVQMYQDLLFKKYNKVQLTKKELAGELEISLSSLDNLISKDDLQIRHRRLGTSQKARYVFPILEVANFLAFIN